MTTEDLTAGQSATNRGGRMALILGVGLGVVAAILVAMLLSRGDEEGGTTGTPSSRVAVSASSAIPARTRLTRDKLQVKTYSVEDVDADAFTSVGQVLNRVTARDITAGEVLVPESVSTTTGEGLTFGLGEGKRAVSIGVSEVIIAGGNISPGDHVDIVGVFSISASANVGSIIEQLSGRPPTRQLQAADGASLVFTILQNVRVLAVAQELSPEVREPTGKTTQVGAIAESAKANPRAATVTLEVTPQQAQAMATADLLGTLRLSLRPFGDDKDVEVLPIILRLN